jgi:glycosyltransferase involved in cell wall biosynthesis
MFRPDIVHSYDYASRAAIPISKIFSRYKNIVSIRKQPGWQYSWWDQVLNSFADCILTNSHKAVESLRLGLQQNVPCQVIYNGIDLQKFDEEANRGFDFELPVDPGSRVICVVARLHPVKGLDILLNAFTKISRAMDNVQLWIVGDGPEMEKLKQQTDRLGIGSKVVFWGQKKNIPSILKQAEIGVLSSHVEGLPNAIIEYMAAKLPVVATNVGGIPELITHNTNGLLVEPNNPDELAMAILTLLNDPRLAEKFGENGRLFVEQNLDLKCMVSKVETIYEILCSKQ